MPRPDWLVDFLPKLGGFLGAGLWCGLYYPCLCQGRVQEGLADHMERETGIRPDFQRMTREAAEVLEAGLRVALERQHAASLDGAFLAIIGHELRWATRDIDDRGAIADFDRGDTPDVGRRDTRDFDPPFRSVVDEAIRLYPRGRGRQRSYAAPTPPVESEQEREARIQRQRERKEAAVNPRYRERVRAALARGQLADMPLSRAARRLPVEYFQTTYTVRTPDGRSFDLRHGALHPELDAWIATLGSSHRHWVFVTAWNPGDARLSEAENRAAQDRLRQTVEQRGWRFFEGVGRLGDWSEESLLVLVPRRSDGIALGSEFRQAAVLVGRLGGHAAVVPCPR